MSFMARVWLFTLWVMVAEIVPGAAWLRTEKKFQDFRLHSLRLFPQRVILQPERTTTSQLLLNFTYYRARGLNLTGLSIGIQDREQNVSLTGDCSPVDGPADIKPDGELERMGLGKKRGRTAQICLFTWRAGRSREGVYHLDLISLQGNVTQISGQLSSFNKWLTLDACVLPFFTVTRNRRSIRIDGLVGEATLNTIRLSFNYTAGRRLDPKKTLVVFETQKRTEPPIRAQAAGHDCTISTQKRTSPPNPKPMRIGSGEIKGKVQCTVKVDPRISHNLGELRLCDTAGSCWNSEGLPLLHALHADYGAPKLCELPAFQRPPPGEGDNFAFVSGFKEEGEPSRKDVEGKGVVIMREVDCMPETEMWERRKLVLERRGLSRATRIVFVPESGNEEGIEPPGCTFQHFSGEEMSCLVAAGKDGAKMEGTRWQPYGLDVVRGNRTKLGGVRILRKVRRMYDPLQMEWPGELGCPFGRTLPLSEEWKMYENISILWTWVNGSDPFEVELRSKFGGGEKVSNRYRESDELRHSFRSYFDFAAPWHKGELLIVARTRPTWVDETKLKAHRVRFVTHEEFIPAKVRPLFNSNTIERHMHLVPGLTNYFLYLNDDIFFRRPVHPCDFFLPGPLGGLRLAMGPFYKRGLDEEVGEVPHNWQWPTNDKHTRRVSVKMTWRYISEAWGHTHLWKMQHMPYAVHRDTFAGMIAKFSHVTQPNRFRHQTDVIPFDLFNMYAFNEGYRHGTMAYQLHTQRELDFTYTGLTNRISHTITCLMVVKTHPLWRAYNLNDFFTTQLPAWLMGVFLQVMHPRPSPLEGEIVENTWGYPEPNSIREALIKFGDKGDKNYYYMRFVVAMLRDHQRFYTETPTTVPFAGEVLSALLEHNPSWG